MRLLTLVQRSNKTFDAQDRVKSNGLAILLLEEILVRSLSAGRIKLLAVQLLAVGDVGERHLCVADLRTGCAFVTRVASPKTRIDGKY